MLLLIGPRHFRSELYSTFTKLCSDPHHSVRRTAAAGLHEVHTKERVEGFVGIRVGVSLVGLGSRCERVWDSNIKLIVCRLPFFIVLNNSLCKFQVMKLLGSNAVTLCSTLIDLLVDEHIEVRESTLHQIMPYSHSTPLLHSTPTHLCHYQSCRRITVIDAVRRYRTS